MKQKREPGGSLFCATSEFPKENLEGSFFLYSATQLHIIFSLNAFFENYAMSRVLYSTIQTLLWSAAAWQSFFSALH